VRDVCYDIEVVRLMTTMPGKVASSQMMPDYNTSSTSEVEFSFIVSQASCKQPLS